MISGIKVNLNQHLYIRNPEDTHLGREIISNSIELIEHIGFEYFTFKKLAAKMNSTEASIYRYFENKQKLLMYLTSWYWIWQLYIINVYTANIEDDEKKLKIILKILAYPSNENKIHFTQFDVELLHKIVISESSKSYLTKDVDEFNKLGMFADYKRLCKDVAEIILKINPNYPFANALVSMLIETAHHQTFFAKHLPSLTNFSKNSNQDFDTTSFLEHLLFSAITYKKL